MCPEVSGGAALEDEEEEETRGVKLSDEENHPDDNTMGGVDGNAKEHHGDARFDGHIGEDVDGFTCPPPLEEGQSSGLTLRHL